MANAGLVKELEERSGGKALSAGELDKIKADMIRDRAIAGAARKPVRRARAFESAARRQRPTILR